MTRGFGFQLNIMLGWLAEQLGRSAYWVGSDAGPGRRDAMLLYFLDVAAAQAFVTRFACGALVLPAGPEDRPL